MNFTSPSFGEVRSVDFFCSFLFWEYITNVKSEAQCKLTLNANKGISMKEITRPQGHSWTLNDLFSQQFVGPFTAVSDDGVTKLPPVIDHSGPKGVRSSRNYNVAPEANMPGGKIVDSTGEVVASAASYTAAHMIARALNLMPTSEFGVMYLGNSVYGSNHHSRKNPWDFWAVKVTFEHEDLDHPGTILKETRYVGPSLFGEFEAPICVRRPIHANKHHSEARANAAIKFLKEVVLPRKCVQDKIEKIKNGKNPWWVKWDTMEAVRIHYLTVEADKNEGTAIMHNPDGPCTRVQVDKD